MKSGDEYHVTFEGHRFFMFSTDAQLQPELGIPFKGKGTVVVVHQTDRWREWLSKAQRLFGFR